MKLFVVVSEFQIKQQKNGGSDECLTQNVLGGNTDLLSITQQAWTIILVLHQNTKLDRHPSQDRNW